MDHRSTLSPSIRVPDAPHHYSPHRPLGRTSVHPSSSGSQAFSRSDAMSIPNARENPVPPPLPPPRFIEDLAVGRDPGWEWKNSGMRGEAAYGSGAASPTSSLPRTPWDTHKEVDMGLDEFGERRRGSSTSTIRSPSRPETYPEYDHRDEGYHSLSGASINFQSVYPSLLLLATRVA